MNKIRIIHLQVLPIFSGVQKAMFDILIRLDRSKYDITVLCQSEGELTELLEQHRIKYILLPELRREISPYYDFVAFIKLYKIFKKNKYNLVHTHSSKSGFIGRLAAKAAGIKCIVHTVQGFAFHEQSSKITKLLVGIMEKIAGTVTVRTIFVNDFDRITATKMKLLPQHKMVTIHNGIELEDYNSSGSFKNIKDLLGFESNGAFVGMVARLWKQKAPLDYIRSIPVVSKKIPCAKFLVIGEGPLKKEMEEKSQKLGVNDNVVFLGWRKDVKDLLKIIDVFVLPSLWEGLPVSILEAMASAKPVVATDIKGNNELVVHGKTGFLVPVKCPQQIGEYILTLLENRTIAQKMGEMGRRRVRSNFNISKTVERINFEYQNLIERLFNRKN